MLDSVAIRLSVELKDSQLLCWDHLRSAEKATQCVHGSISDAEAKHRAVRLDYTEVSTTQTDFTDCTRRAVESSQDVGLVPDLCEFVREFFIHTAEINTRERAA